MTPINGRREVKNPAEAAYAALRKLEERPKHTGSPAVQQLMDELKPIHEQLRQAAIWENQNKVSRADVVRLEVEACRKDAQVQWYQNEADIADVRARKWRTAAGLALLVGGVATVALAVTL